jgi:DNA-binding response OmpR family regulator
MKEKITMKSKKSILIIEDNLKFSKLMKMRLEMEGFDVRPVVNGLDGLNAARTFKPDLILLDIMLPELDGHKISRLLKRDRCFGTIPIIMLTSRDHDKDKELASDTGVEDYLVKTESFEQVLKKIELTLATHPVAA